MSHFEYDPKTGIPRMKKKRSGSWAYWVWFLMCATAVGGAWWAIASNDGDPMSDFRADPAVVERATGGLD